MIEKGMVLYFRWLRSRCCRHGMMGLKCEEEHYDIFSYFVVYHEVHPYLDTRKKLRFEDSYSSNRVKYTIILSKFIHLLFRVSRHEVCHHELAKRRYASNGIFVMDKFFSFIGIFLFS